MDENDAFVQTLALASSYDDFRETIRQAFDTLGFDLGGLEDVEPLATRRQHWTVEDSLLAKAVEVQESGFPRFGDFYTWQSDG